MPTASRVVIRTAVFDATERRHYESELLAAKNRAEASEQRARQLARTLQQTLMPPSLPEIARPRARRRVSAGRRRRPGRRRLLRRLRSSAAGDWLVSVGDVTGKGAEAAVITALARYTIHSAAVRTRSPARILANLNTILIRDATERFCTATVVRLRQVKGVWSATVCNAGHPHPLLVRGGEPPVPLGRLGTLLGVVRFAEDFATAESLCTATTRSSSTPTASPKAAGEHVLRRRRLGRVGGCSCRLGPTTL